MTQRMRTPARREGGFSLIEMMVAVTIGLFILGGLVALMVSSQRNYQVQDYSARLQENARFAVQFLSYDLRMAGYFGCSHNFANTSSDTGAPDVASIATEASSDSITVVYANPLDEGIFIDQVDDIVGAPNVWTLNQLPTDWTVGTPLVASDCGSAVVSVITAVNTSTNTVTVDPNLNRVLDPQSTGPGGIGVRRLISNTYTVNTSGTSGVPVLERNGTELVEGIENMQLLYRTIASDVFAPAPYAGQLAAVKLGVLVRSVSNAADDKQYGDASAMMTDTGNHSVLGTDVSVGSLRGQRRVFSSTMLVRNSNL